MIPPRRQFLARSAAAVGTLAAWPLLAQTTPVAPQPAPPDDPDRRRQGLSVVKAFVQAAHSDLPQVKAMLAKEPNLINASWDWGNGDWETALEGASHMAQTETVTYLLANGARANLFSLAMLGKVDPVRALLDAEPSLIQTRGPHFLTLLFHAALSGRVELTTMVAERLGEDRAQHFNQALRGAAQLGTAEMVAWLIAHGVSQVNEENFWGKTPLDVALERGDEVVIGILRDHGGVRAATAPR